MPETLDRCVQHVISKGHSEQSAFAICRTTLGLLSGGSEDNKPVEMPDEEMRAKVEMALAFQAGVVIKRMVVAKPIGEYVNGPQKGKITSSILRQLVENQKRQPRQIKIFLNGEHPKSNDERPADGWVEDISIDADGNLIADPAKLLGTAAEWVAGDRIRGASIYAVPGLNYQGKPMGPVLKHVLLTDEGYITDINVAARDHGGEAPMIAFTALHSKDVSRSERHASKEAPMADDPKKVVADSPDQDALALKVKTLEEIVETKMRENQELQASNANLLADVDRLKAASPMKDAANEILALKRINHANEVRRKVKDGALAGRFDRAMVGAPETGYDHPSHEGVLIWFKGSIFKDSMDKLDFALATFPKKNLNRTFNSGAPDEDAGGIQPTPDEAAQLRSLGYTPEMLTIAAKAKDSQDYARLKAEKGIK